MGDRAAPIAAVDLTAVIVAVTREVPRILTVPAEPRAAPADDRSAAGARAADRRLDALPSGPLEPGLDRTLELAIRRWVREVSGLELGYVEQLYTFGDRFRHPDELLGGPRRIAVAYLALVREQRTAEPMPARWRDVYAYLPWEDRRGGRPSVVAETIEPALRRWTDAAPDARGRRERLDRADIAFGRGGARWDVDRVLERYELLYELEAVGETPGEAAAGRSMVLDHRRILATAVARLRGKLKYRPLVFELLPTTFTMTGLQRVVESLVGVRLHQGNFRRLVEKGGLVEGTGRLDTRTGGRPAELFRFRTEVLREHPSTGVGLPGIPG